MYPLGYQQAAGEAARAWRVTGYPYYTQVGVRSSRPLPPKHRRLGFSPQHDPRGVVQDPVGFDPQRDLCENVPNHFRTCLSSPGAIPGKTLTAVPQVSGAASGAMPQVSGAVSSAMPQVSGAVSSAMPQVSGAVSSAMPQVSGVVSGAMPQVSGAVSSAMPQVSGAVSSAMPQVSGAVSSAMPQVSGVVSGAMPQVSGAVSSAMPQVSGAVSSAMPQVSGAVSSAMPQVSGAVSGAMPQVSGAVLRAMPRDSDAILDVESKALGAHQDEASHRCSVQGPTGRSIAHKDLVSRPDSRVNPGESSLLSSVRPRQGNSVGQVTKMRCNPNPVGYRPLTPNEWLGDTNQISSPCHSDLRFGPTSPIRRSPSMSSGVAILLSQDKKEQDSLGQIPSVSRKCTTRPGSSVCIQNGAQVSEMPSGSATCVQQGTWVSDVPVSGYECTQLGGQVNQVPLGLSACSPPGAQASQVQPEQQQVNVLSSKGRGNLNLVLGYEGVGRALVSSLGGDEPSLYNLSVSSVATMYRMSSTINREVTRVQTLLTPSAGYLSHQTSDVHARSVGTVEPMDVEGWDGPQIPFLQSEWPSDSGQEQVQCSDVWSPDLVWFILLGKGKLSSFNSGDPSLHYLVSSNGLLNTLGWALGTREANNTGQEVSCDLNAAVSSGQVRCSSKYPVENQKVRLQQEPGKLASSDCLRDSVGAPPKAATVWGPCPHLQKGFCRYGDRCRYEHIVKCASTKPIPTRDWSAVLPFSGQQVCPHFQKGFCKRGQACAFLHIQPESKGPLHQAVGHGETMLVSPSKPKHPPLCAEARRELQSWNLLRECFQYHAGSCNRGKCLFRHSQLEPERKAALMKWIVPDTDPLRKGKPGLQPLPVSAGSAETNDLPTGTQDVSSTPVCATPGVLPNSSNPWGDVPAVPTPVSVLDSPKPHTVARLQAPRPPLHWKGCAATGKLGTTIVATPCRHVGMTSKEGPLPAPRPLSQQPCSLASERPASTLVNYEYGDKTPPKGSLAHSTRSLSCSRKQTNLGRCPRSSSINPPGTQPRVVSLARMKKESQSSVITLSSNTFQRALWADIMDDDEDADLDGGGEVADDPTEGNDDTALFCASVLPSVTSSSASSPGPKELQDQDPVVSSPAAFVKPQRHDSIKGTDQVVLKGEHKPSKGIRSVINKPDADLGPRSFSAAGSKSSMEARTSGSGESSMPVFPTHVKGASDGLRPVYANRCDIKVRGRSLTPRSIRFSPEPVTNHRQVSHASRPKSLGSGVPRLLTLSPATRACSCDGARFSRVLPEVTPATPASSASACPAGAGGGVPAVMCFSQVAGFSKHGLRNESKGFNATLGYPGEGPSMSKAAPVTPPKDAPVMTPEVPGPKTPPKGYRPRTSHKDSRPKSPPNAKKPTPPKGPPPGVWSCEAPVKNLQRSEPASSGDVPPWTQDLEIEVRGLATAYLGRSSGDVGISLTESRRTLAPPKAKANRPQPPRPPAPRAKAQTRATEGTLSPKQMAVYKPPPPPRPRNRQEEDKGPGW